jgi:outer membrane scaffolding protein for murein synthesis (MipA/OmpV family)
LKQIHAGLIALAATLGGLCHAEQAPLWEAGAGVAALSLPAYRGSDKNHYFILPVPYFVYNGDFLKADRQGVRGQLFDNDRIDLNISASASPPTKSDDVPARYGMPNLQPTVELGPEADVTLWRGTGSIPFLKLRLPVREAFTVTAPRRDVGTIFSPNLNADVNDIFGFKGWTLGVVTGPIFATKKQNAYFYSVAPQYATAARPAYSARGGYGGAQMLLSLSKRFDHAWVGAYLRQDTLHGAVYADSPLVAQRSYTSAGVAVSWIFGKSSTMVDVKP